MERGERLRQLLHQTYARELAFVDQLDAAERERIGTFDNWSARDVLAHNAAWKEYLAGELAAASRGKPSARPADFDFNEENERIFRRHQGQGWAQILQTADAAHQSLMAQAAALTEDDLARRDLLPWQDGRPVWRMIVGNGVVHPTLHLADAYRNLGATRAAAEMVAAVGEPLAGLDADPAWQSVVRYNEACGQALLGQSAAALASLRTALALNPELVEWSREDPDLASLRHLPAYRALYDQLG
jgi:hypothetical protein